MPFQASAEFNQSCFQLSMHGNHSEGRFRGVAGTFEGRTLKEALPNLLSEKSYDQKKTFSISQRKIFVFVPSLFPRKTQYCNSN